MQLGLSVSDMKPFGKNKECKNTTNDNCLAPLRCNPKVAGLFQTLCIVQGLSWGMKNYHGAKFGSWLLQGEPGSVVAKRLTVVCLQLCKDSSLSLIKDCET